MDAVYEWAIMNLNKSYQLYEASFDPSMKLSRCEWSEMLTDQNLAVFHLENCALLHNYSSEVDRQAYEISRFSTPRRIVESVFSAH